MNILIIYSGGTIGMKKKNNKLVPDSRYLKKYIQKNIELKEKNIPYFRILQINPLIDSSNINICHWNNFIKIIKKNKIYYDGFIIIHGTDTLSFSASALSYVFYYFKKPIILTGSQFPISKTYKDGHKNLLESLKIIMKIKKGCYIYFHKKLLQGNRSTKYSNISNDAFFVPNPIFQKGLKPFRDIVFSKFKKFKNVNIIVITFFPNIDLRWIRYIFCIKPQVIILRTFGSGNVPNNIPILYSLLKKCAAYGCLIINISQCQHGYVNSKKYAVSDKINNITNIISAGDMTFEAVITKIFYLFSLQINKDKIIKLFKKNLCGERSYY